MARDLGHPGLILSVWLMGGLIALAGALSYSELGAALPVAGGEYAYLRRAYGPFIGFLSGWTSFTRITSYNVCYTKLLRGIFRCPDAGSRRERGFPKVAH